MERRRDFHPSRRAWGLIGALLATVAVALALTIPGQRDSAAEQRRAERADQLALEARERARLRADGRPRIVTGPRRRSGEAPLAYRTRLVTAGQAAITADARARIEAGTIEDPVAGTECAPYPSGPARQALEEDPQTSRGSLMPLMTSSDCGREAPWRGSEEYRFSVPPCAEPPPEGLLPPPRPLRHRRHKQRRCRREPPPGSSKVGTARRAFVSNRRVS